MEAELREAFEERARSDGGGAARRWYVVQVVGFMLRAPLLRAHVIRGREGGMRMGSAVLEDLRWALRSVRRRPTFAAAAVATLALGIGANAAILTLVSAHLFEPLPYERPDELTLVWETRRGDMTVNTVAPGNYFAWLEEASSFADIAAYNVDQTTLSGDGVAERVDGSIVTPNFFDVLGVAAAHGTTFSEGAVRAAAEAQVVLGHGLWVRRFGADPAVVGRDVRIDGRPYTVVGVLEEDFRQPERALTWQRAELWRPMLLDGERDDHGSRYLRTIGRRRAGVSVEEARAEMTALARTLEERHPEANAERSVVVVTLEEYFLGGARPTLLLLLGAGVAVLLIVCANVANLTLARGEERRREFAVRAALGSGSVRLLRQLVAEGVVLALLGAAAGTAVVYASRGVLQRVQSRYFTELVQASVDVRVVALTASLAVLAGVLFGLPAARAATRADLRGWLGEGAARSGSGAGTSRLRDLLIVGQVGAATALLVVAVLLARSFDQLLSVPPGFEPAGVTAFTVSAPSATYPESDDVTRYHRELLREIGSVPGSRRAGMVSDLMFTTENMRARVVPVGRSGDPSEGLPAELHVVGPEYFETLEIPLLQGTVPDAWEEREEAGVVVNRRMAEAYWPAGDAVGSVFTFDWVPGRTFRIEGVVGDVLDDGYAADAEPAFFVPFASMPRRRMSYVVRATGDPAGLLEPVRAAVARVDPDVPAGDLRVLRSMMEETATRPKAASLIGLVFALVALLVSSAGIYGVLSYVVQARTREIGIRAALGAGRSQLMGMVLGRSGRLVAIGVAAGVAGALVAGRLFSGLLFGVRPWDPPTLIVAVGTVAASAFLASWLPARRAIGVAPTEALRAE